jgi:YihY family inner membrane protein
VAANAVAGRPADRRLWSRFRDFVELWTDLFSRHELLTYASSIARTMVVAGVALVLLMLGVLGEIGRKDLWFRHVAPQIKSRVLPNVYGGIDETVRHIFAANSPGLIVFAALLSIWEVSGSVRGLSGALNRIYECDETRSWKVRFPISFALAAAMIVSLMGALLLVMAVGGVLHGAASIPFGIARWVGAILLIVLGFALLVRYAPAQSRAKKWASVGSLLVVLGWVVESLVFRWYVESVASFTTAVGSLTVVLAVIGYLYIASIILLVGIELDELLRKSGGRAERGAMRFLRRLA